MILVDIEEYDWILFFPNMLENSNPNAVGVIEKFSIQWNLTSNIIGGIRYWSLGCVETGESYTGMTVDQLMEKLNELGLIRFHFKFLSE